MSDTRFPLVVLQFQLGCCLMQTISGAPPLMTMTFLAFGEGLDERLGAPRRSN
jgi:hypothetical protein